MPADDLENTRASGAAPVARADAVAGAVAGADAAGLPASHPHLVFVYGTLKRGGSNHHWMTGQRFLGDARLAPGHALYSLGDYPGLVAEPGATERVRGELWAVDEAGLAGLDELEGVADGLYARVGVELVEAPEHVAKDPAALARVRTYLYLRDITGRPRLGESWPPPRTR